MAIRHLQALPETQAERETMKTAIDEAYEIAEELPNPSESGISVCDVLTPHIERLRAEPLEVLRRMLDHAPDIMGVGCRMCYGVNTHAPQCPVPDAEALLADAPEPERKGRPITRREALDIAKQTLEDAEARRAADNLAALKANLFSRFGAAGIMTEQLRRILNEAFASLILTGPQPTALEVAERVREACVRVVQREPTFAGPARSVRDGYSKKIAAVPLAPILEALKAEAAAALEAGAEAMKDEPLYANREEEPEHADRFEE